MIQLADEVLCRDTYNLPPFEIPGFLLRYTGDGSEPTANSREVRGPIPLTREVRVAAFDTRGRKGHTATLIAP